MDISLDLLKNLLCQEKGLESMALNKILTELENGKYDSCKYDEFSFPLFIEQLGTQDYEKDPEGTLIFQMFFADFSIKNALLLADKQKLELFTQIGFKLKIMKSEIMNYYENFLWITIHCGLILKIFNELQDFNDLHKKIKGKILEDQRFYTRFLEISLEILVKGSIEKETFELCNEFLSRLGLLIEKVPSIFKHSQRQMLVVLIKLLSNADFHLLHSAVIKNIVFLNTQMPLGIDKIGETMLNYSENFLFYFRILRSSQETFENFNELTLSDPPSGLLFDNTLLFPSKTKISQRNLLHYISVTLRLFKKTLKNLPEDQEIKFNIWSFLSMAEEILASDLDKLNKIEKNKFLASGLLTIEEFREASLMMKKGIISLLGLLCESAEGMILKACDWLRNALSFVSNSYQKNMEVFLPTLKLLRTCIKLFGTNFLNFSREFILNSPDLLKITLHALVTFSVNAKKKNHKLQILDAEMIKSKSAKNRHHSRNKQTQIISISNSLKEINPFEYLETLSKRLLNKLIRKSIKTILYDVRYFGRFECENSNIFLYEDFLDKGLKLMLREEKIQKFFKIFLSVGEALMLNNRVKGENFSFSVGRFEASLDKFLEKSMLNDKIKGKIIRVKQRIRDLRIENKSSHITAFNNAINIESFIREVEDSKKREIVILEEENQDFQVNYEEKEDEFPAAQIDKPENLASEQHQQREGAQKDIISAEKPHFITSFLEKKPLEFLQEINEIEEDEALPDLKKMAHHGLDFIEKADIFGKRKEDFSDIQHMPKVEFSEAHNQTIAFYDFSDVCSLSFCNYFVYIPLFSSLFLLFLVALLTYYQHRKSRDFDRVQEFIDNIDNKDYFPAETAMAKMSSEKNEKQQVVINQPVIVREKANNKREGVKIRELLRK